MTIVTAGYPYIDIDAYAGCIAYAELLNLKGGHAKAVSTAPLNESISQTVRSWEAPIDKQYSSSVSDDFVLIDISEPSFFEKFVTLEKVVGVIDHHIGFEKYWDNKIGDKAKIEFIGSACTLVYEEWREAGLLSKLSQTSARLLVCGVLDNTLNFSAKITTNRDKVAYIDLQAIAKLPDNWPERYFKECEQEIRQNLDNSLRNDIKLVKFKYFNDKIAFAQIVVWDADLFVDDNRHLVRKYMKQFKNGWFVNLIGLSKKKSTFYSEDAEVQEVLTKLLDVKFLSGIAEADRVWLRKEIIKHDQLIT